MAIDFATTGAKNQLAVVREVEPGDRILFFIHPDYPQYNFQLITWPGHLCLCSQQGTYILTGPGDMLETLHRQRLNIPAWSEYVICEDTRHERSTFSPEIFKNRVKEYLKEWKKEIEDPLMYDLLETEVEDTVLFYADDKEEAEEAIQDFDFMDFAFDDFFDDGEPEVFSDTFIWCMKAIEWAINQYLEVKNA